MRTNRIVLAIAAVLLFSAAALADSVNDPKIIIQGVSGGSSFITCPPSGCEPVGLTFSFTTPGSGSGKLFFTNASGENWHSLALIETGVPASAVTCVQALFLSCQVKTLQNGATEILLSGVAGKTSNAHFGIRNGQNFDIGFKCNGKNDCWPGGLQFMARANVPEPGTIALLTTGLAALFSRRKRWNA